MPKKNSKQDSVDRVFTWIYRILANSLWDDIHVLEGANGFEYLSFSIHTRNLSDSILDEVCLWLSYVESSPKAQVDHAWPLHNKVEWDFIALPDMFNYHSMLYFDPWSPYTADPFKKGA